MELVVYLLYSIFYILYSILMRKDLKQSLAWAAGLIVFGFITKSGLLTFLGAAMLYFIAKQHGFNLKAFTFNSLRSRKQPMEVLDPRKNKKILASMFGFIVLIIVLAFASSFWVVVEAGQTGVQSLFGKVRDKEFNSGFHLKNPLVKVTKLNIRTQDYTMSVARGEGNRVGADAISALTKEGLSVDLDITVLYHLQEEKASDVYRDVGRDYGEVIIRPQVRSVIREVIANYDAKDIYSEKREEAAQVILDRLSERLLPRGIEPEEVLLRHVALPENLANSIQEKLQAEQDAQRYDFLLEKEKKEAERKRLEAQGQRDAQAIINQSLSRNYLHYLYIQSLKELDGTIYVPTDPSSGLPTFRNL